jgi:hypothetical protein
MKFSLRTLLIAGMLGPPLLALLYAALTWDPFGGRPELVPVRGVVTLDGQSVADVAIYFAFDDGNFANGITNGSGEYVLGFMGHIGCPPQPAKVSMSTTGGLTSSKAVLPARYCSPRLTPLTAQPQRGKANRIDFQLTTP